MSKLRPSQVEEHHRSTWVARVKSHARGQKQPRSLTDWATDVLRKMDDPAWQLGQHTYQPALEHDLETRFAVGNGFIGVRGSLIEPTVASRPRTFIRACSTCVQTAACPRWSRRRTGCDCPRACPANR